MPAPMADSGVSLSFSLFSPHPHEPPVFPLHHSLSLPISRFSLSWSRGNCLRVSLFHHQSLLPSQESRTDTSSDDIEVGGKVVEVKLSGGNGIFDDARWRRISYGSVTPYALLQSQKNSVAALSKTSDHIMGYSNDIKSVLSDPVASCSSIIDDPRKILKVGEEPSDVKAAWELLEIFYADKQSQAWLPERMGDWLADYDSILSEAGTAIYSELAHLQNNILYVQVIEDDSKYWEGILSALAVGWLDVVVKLLRLHGSYHLEQLGSRETENGLVEAIVVLVSKMPRLRPSLPAGRLGVCYRNRSDFIKAWEIWRSQITKLDCSGFWVQCDHQLTRQGLRNMLQIMLGNTESLATATCHWIEFFVSHFLYVRPFTVGLESMYILAQKCTQIKPVSHRLCFDGLLLGILGENTEVVLSECSKAFGLWMVTHCIELLTAKNDQSEFLVKEERDILGGISIEELHRVVYAQILASHALTWQIAPIYLMSCMKQGMMLLEYLICKQPVQHSQGLLKSMEICRLYEMDNVSAKIMKIAGMYHWKHGHKGCGIFWLQQAQDEVRLNKIAQQLFDFVGKSICDDSFKQWEGLIELLGSNMRTAGGLEFLHKYRDLKKSLQQVQDEKATNAAKQAVDSLIMLPFLLFPELMKNPSTPQHFWLPLLYDSLKLLTWEEGSILNVAQTNLLLNKLQELSMAKLRPDYIDHYLPPQALSFVRLALATNLGRAILED
ncbi:hypothetical protein V2J09_022368 [Rumex salicifolius]